MALYELLKNIPLFANLSEDDLLQLCVVKTVEKLVLPQSLNCDCHFVRSPYQAALM